MKLEALKALQAAADAGHDGLAQRWTTIFAVVAAITRVPGVMSEAHASPQRRQTQRQQPPQHRTEAERWAPQQQHSGWSEGHSGSLSQETPSSAAAAISTREEANEQCGLQALRLLAAALAHLSRSASYPSPDDFNPVVRAWLDAWTSVLQYAVRAPSPQVRAAGIAAIAGVTPELCGQMFFAMTQEMLWRSAAMAARDDAPMVRAAAARAAAAFAAFIVRPHGEAGDTYTAA